MTDSTEPTKVDLETPDLGAVKRSAFEDLFPGVLADGVLDAGRLSEILDAPVSAPPDGRERFGLMWAGKQEAVRSLLTPSRGTLVPVLGKSVGFDTARNVLIEGDNLEVLKLLQKAYNDRVKLIYIDPPYNTGNDFVYNDDFVDGLRGYLEYTGQLDDEGKRTSAVPELAGRRHSRWLSMMYPRLVLARNLLTRDGVIAISIDANEVHQLALIMDEIFGAENFLNSFVWVSNLKGRQISDGGAVGTHEYVIVYARDSDQVPQFRGSLSELQSLMPSVYKGAGYEVKHDAKGAYVTKNELYNTNSKFNEKTAPTMIFRIHYNPASGEVKVTDVDDPTRYPGFAMALPHANSRPGLNWHAWRWSRAKILADSEELEFEVSGESLRIWTKIRDVDGVAVKDLIIGPSTVTGQADLQALGMARLFDTPKPISLLQVFVSSATSDHDLVLDFFAGSGSTAHAVASQNATDGGSRRCISVNLPEPVPPGSPAAEAGMVTVAEITHLRLTKVLDTVDGAASLGLRCLRLAESNFIRPGATALDLFDLRVSTVVGRVDHDAIAAEVLLNEGIALDVPWERTRVDEAQVVLAGGVAVVLTLDVTDEVASAAFDLKPRVVVFLEDGFAGKDAVKANAFTNAKNLGITMKTV